MPVYGLSTLDSRVLPTSGEVPAPFAGWTEIPSIRGLSSKQGSCYLLENSGDKLIPISINHD
ncbi:MAG: hypothetical protein ACXADA_15290 [Candidatus Hodarchaeales archaeon]